MRILVYEHLSANPPPPDATAALIKEGRAMLQAAVDELASVVGVEVVAPMHEGHGGADVFPSSGSPSGSHPSSSGSFPPCGGGLRWGRRKPNAHLEASDPPGGTGSLPASVGRAS